MKCNRMVGPFAVIDIGSSKIICLIAQASPQGAHSFCIRSLAYTPSQGFYAGEVTNFFKAVESLRRNVAEAEERIGVRVKGIFAHCAFKDVISRLNYVRRSVHKYVTREDIEALTQYAQSRLNVPPTWQDIYTAPVYYILDDLKIVEDPCGLMANSLGAVLHTAFIKKESVASLKKCLEQAHLDLFGILPSPYASGLACLSLEERQKGVIHIDMGKSGTHMALFISKTLASIYTHPCGGDDITKAIAQAKNLSFTEAERLKIEGKYAELTSPILVNIFTCLKAKLTESPFYRMMNKSKLVLNGMAHYTLGAASLAQKIFAQHTVLTAQELYGLDNQSLGMLNLDPALISAAVGTLLHSSDMLSFPDEVESTLVAGKLSRAWRWMREHF